MAHIKNKFRSIPIPPVTSEPHKPMPDAVRALTEGYETITRQRGSMESWLVTFDDLVEMGLITEEKAHEYVTSIRGH